MLYFYICHHHQNNYKNRAQTVEFDTTCFSLQTVVRNYKEDSLLLQG